jgi:hypothetical protein
MITIRLDVDDAEAYAFAEFLKTRMTRALETEDPTELHYLLAQLDDYHSYLWRYYKKLASDRSERMNPGV